jgi:hypothetical protein
MTLVPPFSCERVSADGDDPDAPPASWRMTWPDGRKFVWEGFYEGPLMLSRQELQAITRDLLGLDLEDVPAASAACLTPYVGDGSVMPSLVVHSATPVLKSFEADLDDAINGRVPDDVPAYVETRAVSLAAPGDLVVGRTRPWKLAAELAGADAVSIPGIDYYYLSHAILKLASVSGGRGEPLVRIAQALRDRPETVVRLYSLDREAQVALLYLMRLAGIETLSTDANSPEVGDYWNAKAPLHPTVEDALELDPPSLDPHELLAAETELAPLARRLGLRLAVLPGYTVDAADSPDEVVRRFLAAAELLTERYGIRLGCLKPSNSGAGARIVLRVPLEDEAELRRLAAQAAQSRETYVFEAHVEYLPVELGGTTFPLAPSGHVRHGHVADGLTLQFTEGTSWQGNVYVDEAACEAVGLAADRYRAIVEAMEELHDAFTRHDLGLVTAGVDFAVGRVGGVFGAEVLVGAQDLNLSSHGAEYLRLFLDEVRAGGRMGYAATKVICPVMHQTLSVLRGLEHQSTGPLKVISAIPGRWGLIAAAAEDPLAAADKVLSFHRELVARGSIA